MSAFSASLNGAVENAAAGEAVIVPDIHYPFDAVLCVILYRFRIQDSIISVSMCIDHLAAPGFIPDAIQWSTPTWRHNDSITTARFHAELVAVGNTVGLAVISDGVQNAPIHSQD
jgi:hypothetical protein